MSISDRIRVACEFGLSHRQAAKAFGVSLRQVQKAVNPERRRRYDSVEYKLERDPEWRARAARYNREWKAANPDRVRAIKRRYYAAHKEELLEKQRAWRKAHPSYFKSWPSKRVSREGVKACPGASGSDCEIGTLDLVR